jgi:predicted RNase H-like HicB family nuclease
MRQVIVYKLNGCEVWMATCPSLPGCIVQATSKVDALEAIRRAIDEYVLELKKHNAPIPEDTAEAAVVLV